MGLFEALANYRTVFGAEVWVSIKPDGSWIITDTDDVQIASGMGEESLIAALTPKPLPVDRAATPQELLIHMRMADSIKAKELVVTTMTFLGYGEIMDIYESL